MSRFKQNRVVTGLELLTEHVERFNAGVRSGDFGPMFELFADDAVLEFEGVRVGPFHGREAIAAAYRAQPPDDEIEVLEVEETGAQIRARYAWLHNEGRASGDLRLSRDGDRITRLVVTFET
jgi:ketosteroid isomerase-like protein